MIKTITRTIAVAIIFAALIYSHELYNMIVDSIGTKCETDSECYQYCMSKIGSTEADCSDILR